MMLGSSLFHARERAGSPRRGSRSAWAKKCPILATYQGEVNVSLYARRIAQMLDELKAEYGYSELDAMLALKDILYQVWKARKAKAAR